MTDCAKYLNGYGRGARYDGSYLSDTKIGECGWQNNIDQWSQEMKDNTRRFIGKPVAIDSRDLK